MFRKQKQRLEVKETEKLKRQSPNSCLVLKIRNSVENSELPFKEKGK